MGRAQCLTLSQTSDDIKGMEIGEGFKFNSTKRRIKSLFFLYTHFMLINVGLIRC